MIYVDSCIPMYLIGSAHPLKSRVIDLVSSLINAREQLITSAEVFQEILHRYKALNDLTHMRLAYDALEELVEATANIEKLDTDRARLFIQEFNGLSSRDSLHLGVMKRLSCSKIWTYDQRFDSVPWVTRIQ